MAKQLQLTIEPFSEVNAQIRKMLGNEDRNPVRKDGKVFFRIGEAVYSCPDTSEASAFLAGILCGNIKERIPDGEEETWRAVLKRTAGCSSLLRYGIREKTPRCVVLLHPLQYTDCFALQENIPIEETDRIVRMENGDAALILNMSSRSPEEVDEYAAALTETMESEAGISSCAGIGKTAETLDGVSRSYEEAKAAMATGIRHRIPGRVYAYDRLTLERMADLIPESSVAEFRQAILPPQAEKLLTAEMLETIRVFFQNDLNLSTTARQLYIHRNTLIYRMDKIRKATGLDLRIFEDAAVFRLMLCFSGSGD